MSEILQLIINHQIELILIWIVAFVVLMVFLRKLYWSIVDPIVISLALIIAPGIAGMICIALYLDSYQGFYYKSAAFSFSILAFFYGLKRSHLGKKYTPHDLHINASLFWQTIVLVLAACIIILNLYINGNFDSSDPANRFSNVTVPTLNYLSIALTAYPAIFFAFTRDATIRKTAAAILVVIAIIQINAGSSKSSFITWLMVYFYWNFSRNKFEVKSILFHMSRLSFNLSALKFFFYSILLGGGAAIYLLASNLTDAISLFIRFVLPFDSPAIFIASENILMNSPQSVTGFYTFLEVWLKPFLKNVFSINFTYENISQYLAYELTGYRATDYSETAWQPNNNILIDFLVTHGWLSLFFSYFFGLLLGKSLYALKTYRCTTRNSFPFFVLVVITPFYLFSDAQSFITSAILSSLFVYSINISYEIIKKSFL